MIDAHCRRGGKALVLQPTERGEMIVVRHGGRDMQLAFTHLLPATFSGRKRSPTISNPGYMGASSPWATTISSGETAGLMTTSSPTDTSETSEPIDSTIPATSQPGT